MIELVRDDPGVIGRADDDAAARQALGDIVVAIADQLERDAARQEGAEGLARRAAQGDCNRVLAQTLVLEALGHFTRQHRAGGSVDVADLDIDLDRLAGFQRGLRHLDQLAVEHVIDRMLLALGPMRGFTRRVRLVEQLGEVETPGLPMVHQFALFEQVGVADDLIDVAEAHLGQEGTHLVRHVEEEVDDMLRLALEALAQDGILRGHADGAGVQMALAHHDAAGGDQRCGREAELICAQQRADDRRHARCEGRHRPARQRGCAGRSAPAFGGFRQGPFPMENRHA